MHSAKIFHVAIIPDGNRRWAKQHGLMGYKDLYDQGISRITEITEAAFEHNVTHLSLWGSSHANLSDRSNDFFHSIDKLYRENIHKFAKHPLITKHDVKIQVIGEWRDSLSPQTIETIDHAMAATAHHTSKILTLLLDYSGTRERAAAITKVSLNPIKNVDEANQLLHKASWTRSLPEVDLVIRTGAWQDPHNSAGFLSMLVDEAQYAFPAVLWPDFTGTQLTEILDDFTARERRKGK